MLEYVMFELPGWTKQNSSHSQRQNAREPKVPLPQVFWPLICQLMFSDIYLMRSFLHTFRTLGYFWPNYLLAPTNREEKQLYNKTALLKTLEAPFHSKAILPFLQEYLYFTGILGFKQVLKAGFTFVKFKSEGSPLILESYCWLKMNSMLLYYKWLLRFAVITRDRRKHLDLRITPLDFTLLWVFFPTYRQIKKLKDLLWPRKTGRRT